MEMWGNGKWKIEMGRCGWRGWIRIAEALWTLFGRGVILEGGTQILKNKKENIITYIDFPILARFL